MKENGAFKNKQERDENYLLTFNPCLDRMLFV